MRGTVVFITAINLGVLQACQEQTPTLPVQATSNELPVRASKSRKSLDVSACAFGQGFTLEPGNAYYPLGVGSEWRLEGEDDGAWVELHVSILDETEVVGGVTTRVLEEVEWEDGELVEVSRNFVAGTLDGTVCYFGEDVDDYEDSEIVSHEGVWRADADGSFPGILMPAEPRPGVKFQMEGAPGQAEDRAKIVGSGPVRVPAGAFRRTIRLREIDPFSRDFDFKAFAASVGILTDGALLLVSYEVTD